MVAQVKAGQQAAERPRPGLNQLPVSKAIHQVIVHHSRSLHKRIANRRPCKLKPPLPQLLAHLVRLRSGGWNSAMLFPRVHLRLSVDKLPDEPVETPELLLDL